MSTDKSANLGWIHTDEQPALRQGDVLHWVDGPVEYPYGEFGIVVTGDCDIEWGKQGSYVSFVPVISIDSYFKHEFFPDICSAEIETRLNKIHVRVNKYREKKGKSVPMTKSVVGDWIYRCGPEKFLYELGVSDKGERNSFMDILKPYYELRNYSASGSAKEQLSASELYMPKVNIKERLTSAIKNCPGNMFYIERVGPDSAGGFIAKLSSVGHIAMSQVALNMNDVITKGASVRRICRLADRFTFGLTRKLGAVFMDIGMPEQHDALRDTCAERFINKISN